MSRKFLRKIFNAESLMISGGTIFTCSSIGFAAGMLISNNDLESAKDAGILGFALSTVFRGIYLYLDSIENKNNNDSDNDGWDDGREPDPDTPLTVGPGGKFNFDLDDFVRGEDESAEVSQVRQCEPV